LGFGQDRLAQADIQPNLPSYSLCGFVCLQEKDATFFAPSQLKLSVPHLIIVEAGVDFFGGGEKKNKI
jgi:hypothetical protein